MTLLSPALAGRFFISSATWEAQYRLLGIKKKKDANEPIYKTETDSQKTNLRIPEVGRGRKDLGIDIYTLGSLGGSDGEESACNTRDPALIPGSGSSPGEENGYPLQCSCLENPMDREAWHTQSSSVQFSSLQLFSRV